MYASFRNQSFLQKQTHSQLEQIVTRLKLNASNNYRDATKEDLAELEKKYGLDAASIADAIRRRGL